MPGFNRRGPDGCGPKTGRGNGYCNAALSPTTLETSPRELLSEKEANQPALEYRTVYGLGRGGIPRGCGMGYGR